MKKDFWIEKWQNNQIGFHQDFTHPLLIEYINKLGISIGDTIFVPLCGKSIDMLWLNNQGFNVIGIELSDLAIEQFFAENKLEYVKSTDKLFDVYSYENITIYQGDFFALAPKHTIDVKAIYDRAALIALPGGLVEKYVEHMYALMPKNTSELLITLELQRATDVLGPPFSSPDKKVHDLFASFTSIKLLQMDDIVQKEEAFKKQGCEYVYERVYLINF